MRPLLPSAIPLLVLTTVRLAGAALLVDDFEGAPGANALGGPSQTYTDSTVGGTTTISAITHVPGPASANAARVALTFGPGYAFPNAGWLTALSPHWSEVDVSAYHGVRFWARGQGSARVQVATTPTSTEYNHFEYAFELRADWQLIEVPFTSLSQTWGTRVAWDPKTALSVGWTLSGNAGGTAELVVDDVELYLSSEATATYDPNPILLTPKVNQVGFLPGAVKKLTIVATAAAPGAPFTVRDASGRVAYEARLDPTPIDATASAGETVLRGDFSPFRGPGTFTVAVGEHVSHPFRIGDDAYARVFRDAARTFYLIRSGVAIDDQETGIQHGISHADDAILRDDPTTRRDLAGGWYNAGDFGKWVHMAALATTHLLLLHELNPAASAATLDIPESHDAVPDLLDQARWGLEWMLKMQNPDGSVLHKVDSEPAFAWGLKPDADPHVRRATPASSMDAAFFVGALLTAERVFRPLDPTFATRCRTAADAAWAWLVAHPDVRHDDPYYKYWDDSQREEYLFALAERTRATGDAALAAELGAALESHSLAAVNWMNPTLLGWFSVARAEGLEAPLRERARAKITALADGFVSRAAESGYGEAIGPTEYYWGSVENLLNITNALLFAHSLTGAEKYRDTALQQLDFVLGNNALSRSYVAGHGAGAVQHPYHWTCITQGIALPGWASGGPNGRDNGGDTALERLRLAGTPPQKCHVDACTLSGSFASNEGQVSENAALVFATGYFVPATTAGGAGGAGGAKGSGGAGNAGGVPASGSGASSGGDGCGCGVATPTRFPWLLVLALGALAGARVGRVRGAGQSRG